MERQTIESVWNTERKSMTLPFTQPLLPPTSHLSTVPGSGCGQHSRKSRTEMASQHIINDPDELPIISMDPHLCHRAPTKYMYLHCSIAAIRIILHFPRCTQIRNALTLQPHLEQSITDLDPEISLRLYPSPWRVRGARWSPSEF